MKSPSDFKTRPTSDRLRETIFNILNPQINQFTNFLDLCAGTGAVGIEALSRGAGHTTFVEISRKMCGLIEKNLDYLEIPEPQTDIICERSEKFLNKTKSTFDLVYFDPPYQNDYLPVLQIFSAENSDLLSPQAVLIAEHSTKTDLPDLLGQLRRWRFLKQGESCLSFFEKK